MTKNDNYSYSLVLRVGNIHGRIIDGKGCLMRKGLAERSIENWVGSYMSDWCRGLIVVESSVSPLAVRLLLRYNSSHEDSDQEHGGSPLPARPYRRIPWRLCDGCAGVEATAVGRSVGPRGAGGDHGHGRDPLSYSPDGSRRETHDDWRDGFRDV